MHNGALGLKDNLEAARMWLQKAVGGDFKDGEYRAICAYGDFEEEELKCRLEHGFAQWRLEQEEEEEGEDGKLEFDSGLELLPGIHMEKKTGTRHRKRQSATTIPEKEVVCGQE